MPMKKILLAAVLGGVAFFLWSWISHGVLPLYSAAFHGFTNEAEVVQAIVGNAPTSGMYFLPWMPEGSEGMSEEQKDAAMKKAQDQFMNGPFVFASIRVGPMGSYPMLFVTQLLTDILAALFIALVLARSAQSPFKTQMLSGLWIGLAGSCALTLPSWNWYAFSTTLTLAEIIDTIVGFLFAGMVVARVLRGKSEATSQQTA